MLTFAKATPLVFIQKKKPVPVSDETRSDFNMRMKMMNALESTGKQFKVKFDILSQKLLKDVAKNGSRLLHITSDIGDENKLCFEGRYGIANEIPFKRLDQTLG